MSAGKLFVVATPIGNLGDMVPRAVDCLQSVDVIAAEDTRRTGQLCSHFDIRTTLRAYHDHNEEQQAGQLVELIQQGQNIALVSDAGMPLVSDPGFRLVRAAREADIDVTVIPGPCALIAALAGAGMPSDRFLFMGFPPAKEKARVDWFSAVKAETATLICYESSHRIQACLQSLKAVYGNERRICIARELTKTYETWLQGYADELIEILESDANQCKGEFVLVIEGSPENISTDELQVRRYMESLMKELPIKKAAAVTAELLGVSKKFCYDTGLKIKAL